MVAEATDAAHRQACRMMVNNRDGVRMKMRRAASDRQTAEEDGRVAIVGIVLDTLRTCQEKSLSLDGISKALVLFSGLHLLHVWAQPIGSMGKRSSTSS